MEGMAGVQPCAADFVTGQLGDNLLQIRGRRLTLGGTVPIDDAIAAWREGKDPVLLMVEGIRRRVANGELDLGDS